MPPPQPPPKVCRKKKDSCSKTLYLEVFAPLLTVGDQWVTQPMERVVKRLQNTAVNPRLKRQPREWTDSTILQSRLETTTRRVKNPKYCSQSTLETTQRGKRLHNTAVNPSLKQQHRGWGRDSTILQSRQLSILVTQPRYPINSNSSPWRGASIYP